MRRNGNQDLRRHSRARRLSTAGSVGRVTPPRGDCQEEVTGRHSWTAAALLPVSQAVPGGTMLSPNMGSVQIHA